MTQKRKKPFKPELLAPAGSLESFNAAIEAGADAIYLGVGEMNARLRARNFSIKNLSFLVSQAKKHRVKLYVTVNTLIKQDELPLVLNLLYQLHQLQVDAVIVQDLGLVYLAQNHFPHLTLHASTQMVVHNTLGMKAVEASGIKRAVLSRELTFEEIRAIKTNTDVELEVFIHGALCYSISGLCLASSCIGGWSGNRGRCTQVCRRKFHDKNNSGFYFSPKDFWAVDHIDELARLGISSFKIEGRMKRAEYVFNVVSAYRKLLDGHAEAAEVKEMLQLDTGRDKTGFFLNSLKEKNIVVTDRPSGTGLYIGEVIAVDASSIEIKGKSTLQPGDSIRIQNLEGDEGKTLTINKTDDTGSNQVLFFNSLPAVNLQDQVFLLAHKQKKNNTWNKFDSSLKPTPFQRSFPKTQKVLKSLNQNQSSANQTSETLVRINHEGWLNSVKEIKTDYLVISGDFRFFEKLLKKPKQLTYWKQKLVVEFPLFIPENELEEYKKLVSKFSNMGIQRWMGSHYSHKWLFPESDTVIAGPSVWVTNQATQKILSDSNYKSFTYSVEDDLLNIKAMTNSNGIFPLYGLVPLFVSRIKPSAETERIEDANGVGFIIRETNGLSYTLHEKPLCLFHRREKLKGLGIHRFLIDLNFIKPSRKTLKALYYDYEKGQRTQGTIIFNHKSGFK